MNQEQSRHVWNSPDATTPPVSQVSNVAGGAIKIKRGALSTYGEKTEKGRFISSQTAKAR